MRILYTGKWLIETVISDIWFIKCGCELHCDTVIRLVNAVIRVFVCFSKRKIFTPKLTLLTEDEYHREGLEETKKALHDLRGYCSSPECNQWKTVLTLKDPCRLRQNKRCTRTLLVHVSQFTWQENKILS